MCFIWEIYMNISLVHGSPGIYILPLNRYYGIHYIGVHVKHQTMRPSMTLLSYCRESLVSWVWGQHTKQHVDSCICWHSDRKFPNWDKFRICCKCARGKGNSEWCIILWRSMCWAWWVMVYVISQTISHKILYHTMYDSMSITNSMHLYLIQT